MPHHTEPPSPPANPALLDLIGNTPLLQLRKIPPKGCAEVWVKCEHLNPGGSVKDRVALAMIQDAEAKGRLELGRSTLVEPTSGNTGIGLALVCAARGYPLILAMPESMSLERRALLKSYGAQLILTPEALVMQGAVNKAKELLAENPNYFMPDQFQNPANPLAHERGTGPEILEQLAGKEIHAFVAAIGTGGTISGVGRSLRRVHSECAIVGVEPENSQVIQGKGAGPHKIQGIGAGFIPGNLDRRILSEMRSVSDRNAFDMARRLAKEEGLLVGLSAGANVHIACQFAQELGPDKRVVTILCDTGERYFSVDDSFH